MEINIHIPNRGTWHCYISQILAISRFVSSSTYFVICSKSFILSVIACATEHARLCLGKYVLCTTFSVYESLCPNWGYIDWLIILSRSLMRMSNKWDEHKKVTIYNMVLSALNRWYDEVNEYLEKYMIICQILWCATGAIYMWQNSILIFSINAFQRKKLTQILSRCAFCLPFWLLFFKTGNTSHGFSVSIVVSHASDW